MRYCFLVAEDLQQATTIIVPEGRENGIETQMHAMHHSLRDIRPGMVADGIELKAVESFVHQELLCV